MAGCHQASPTRERERFEALHCGRDIILRIRPSEINNIGAGPLAMADGAPTHPRVEIPNAPTSDLHIWTADIADTILNCRAYARDLASE